MSNNTNNNSPTVEYILHVWYSGSADQPQDEVKEYTSSKEALIEYNKKIDKGYSVELVQEVENDMKCQSCGSYLKDEEYLFSPNNECPYCQSSLIGKDSTHTTDNDEEYEPIEVEPGDELL